MCIKNDGNAIKPSTEFDSRLKKGVGLNIDVDIDFVKSNEVTPAFLNEHIVTEVLTSYISVNLVGKELPPRNIFSITRTRAKATVALACQKRLCEESATDKVMSSHLPCLRACNNCLERGELCGRWVFLMLTADCEEGNKEDASIDPELLLLSMIPEVPHGGKNLKAGFSNGT